MSAKTVATYGRWPSQLTANALADGSVRFGAPKILNEHYFWPQSLPDQGGRTTIMYKTGNQTPHSLLNTPWEARSKAHEYGGGALAVNDLYVYFVNASDQQIYCLNWQQQLNNNNEQPRAITECIHARFTDLVLHPKGLWLFAVREIFTDTKEPTAQVIAIKTDGSNELIILAEGADFYAGLCAAPCGKKIAYISWDHPYMPWDKTQLWEASWHSDDPIDSAASLIAGTDVQESIVQPGYSPNGQLFYVSDKNNWWNIYQQGNEQAVIPIEGECATPQWTFGMQNWGFIDAQTILFSVSINGLWQLKCFDMATQKTTPINATYSVYSHIHSSLGQAIFLAASFHQAHIPVHLKGQTITPLTQLSSPLAAADISEPQSFWFTTNDQQQAHLFFYPPCNKNYQAHVSTKPPIIILGHGGPTAAAEPVFNLKIQFWTNRGFAVADVNYRGSTGFGREYRNRLLNNWGVADVEDLCNAARFLETKGLVHPQQKIIKGSSAGGFTALAALTQQQVFNAGVSFYGIADLHALAKDTHKFEAHYLDGLIGPYPSASAIYTQRSPINHIDKLNCPLFIAQGLDDQVVPPSQAELIVKAAKAKGLYVEYLSFTGEGHGFRKAESLIELCDRELAFYRKVFRFDDTINV